MLRSKLIFFSVTDEYENITFIYNCNYELNVHLDWEWGIIHMIIFNKFLKEQLVFLQIGKSNCWDWAEKLQKHIIIILSLLQGYNDLLKERSHFR